MADKASRGLVVMGEGVMSQVSPSHSHFHSLASLAACGFLALRHSKKGCESGIGELAQLLDAYEFIQKNHQHVTADSKLDFPDQAQEPVISNRFMGLKAALFTTCSSTKSLGRALGFDVLEFNELMGNSTLPTDPEELPDVITTAPKLLKLLGFSEGQVLEKSDFDLVFVHIKASEKAMGPNVDAVSEVEWLNAFTGGIIKIAQPGSKVASRLHFSLVMSYGAVSENEDVSSLTLASLKGTKDKLSSIVPRQSYTMKGGNFLDDVRHHHPMLVAQWQEALTRKDTAQRFCFQEFQELGANLTILADRFLHELAFKLWKAPKYGA